jgi:hypothetical protein
MPDYSKCVIYTIRTGEGLYVGSTCNYIHRKYNHKERSKKSNEKLYMAIRENNGEWDMQPHSEYPCNSKIEMNIEEERVRKELKADLNSNVCYTGLSTADYQLAYRIINNEYSKNYYISNKEKITKKVSCECGGKYLSQNKTTHFKTQKHLKYIKDSQAPPL